MAPSYASIVALLAACVLPELCTSFGVMPGALTLRSMPTSGACRFPVRGARFRMSSEGDGGQGSSAKEDLLKKLAATGMHRYLPACARGMRCPVLTWRIEVSDTPKGPPPKEVKKSALPEWFYFALPFMGAATAFAIQYFTRSPLPVG